MKRKPCQDFERFFQHGAKAKQIRKYENTKIRKQKDVNEVKYRESKTYEHKNGRQLLKAMFVFYLPLYNEENQITFKTLSKSFNRILF